MALWDGHSALGLLLSSLGALVRAQQEQVQGPRPLPAGLPPSPLSLAPTQAPAHSPILLCILGEELVRANGANRSVTGPGHAPLGKVGVSFGIPPVLGKSALEQGCEP